MPQRDDVGVPHALDTPACALAECPLWNVAEQALYWTDIPNGVIWRYDPATGKTHQAWQGDRQVGGFAFAGDGRIVLCSDRDVALLNSSTGQIEPIEAWSVPLAEDERFNDVTTDPAGRLLAGTLTQQRTDGILYRFEAGKAPLALLRDLHTSNGMAFSADQTTFYHTDSRPGVITRYAYDVATGEIRDPAVVHRRSDEPGSPDGLTIDSDGCLWAAYYRGGCVRRLSPDGRVLAEICLPTPNVTSVAFGGTDLQDLYITTGRCERGESGGLGGQVFRVRMPVAGRAEWSVRI